MSRLARTPRVEYEPTPSTLCGTCGRALVMKNVRWPVPVFHYVHADDHRFRCRAAWWRRYPTAQSRDLLLSLEWHRAKDLHMYDED